MNPDRNLGKIQSDVITEAAFIPPASPACRKTWGVLTVNGRMKLCQGIFPNKLTKDGP